MKQKKPDLKQLSRRSFVVGSAALAAGSAAGACLPGVDGEWRQTGLCSGTQPLVTMGDAAQAGRVVEYYNFWLTTSYMPPRIIECEAIETVKHLLRALTGKATVQGAWQQILPDLQPEQTVGIKVNTLNKNVPTHREIVRGLVELLKNDAGVKPEKILVWDRRLDELTAAGYTEDYLGCKVEGTHEDASQKGVGRGYELSPVCIGGQNARLSNIQTRVVDHLINVAVVKNHRASGFTGCLKNHYGTIHNPGEFHDETGTGGVVIDRRFERAIPAINALDEVAGKARLWILDASIIVARGDTDSPADSIGYTLLAGLDPVALDLRGRQIRDEAAEGTVEESISDGWLKAAEQAGLGKNEITQRDYHTGQLCEEVP